MKEGIYRLFRLYPGDDGRVQQRLLGRFVLYGEKLMALEDHDGIVESLAPEGRVTDGTLAQLRAMSHSPYWRLTHENDIQAGEHEDLLPEADAGPGEMQEQG